MDHFDIPKPQSKQRNYSESKSDLESESTILEEEEYLENLSKIIRRDFFPDLHQHLQNQSKYRLFTNSDEYSDPEILKRKDRIEFDTSTLSLNQFIQKYQSEDNKEFKQILEKDQEKWKQQNWWIFENEKKAIQRQLAIQASNDNEYSKLRNMISCESSLKHGQMAIASFSALNGVFHTPLALQSDKKVDQFDNSTLSLLSMEKDKQILIENSRFDTVSEIKEELRSRMNSQLQGLTPSHEKLLSTPLLAGLHFEDYFKTNLENQQNKKLSLDELYQNNPLKKAKEQHNSEQDIEIRGYQMVKMASPSPNLMESPLITWGTLEDDPIQLQDRSHDFRFQKPTQRESVANEIAQKITQKQDEQKKINQEFSKKKLLETVSPFLNNTKTPGRLTTGQLQSLIQIKKGSASILSSSPSGLSSGSSSQFDTLSQSQFNISTTPNLHIKNSFAITQQ